MYVGNFDLLCCPFCHAGLRGAGPSPADPNAVADMPFNCGWPPRGRFRPVCSALMHESWSTIATEALWPPESTAMSLVPRDASCDSERMSRTINVAERHKCVHTTRTGADWCTFPGNTVAARHEHSQLTCGCTHSGACGSDFSALRFGALARIFRRIQQEVDGRGVGESCDLWRSESTQCKQRCRVVGPALLWNRADTTHL